MKTTKIGSGMTEHKVELFDPNDPDDKALLATQIEASRKRLTEAAGHFPATVLPVLQECERILEDVRRGVKSWDSIEDDSPEDFASKIAAMIRAAKFNLAQGDADQAAMQAFIAGCMLGRSEMKWKWETHAMRGEKVAGGGRNSAKQTNARHEPLRRLRFERMAQLITELGSVDSAAAQCETEGLGTHGAIKRQWNRFRK